MNRRSFLCRLGAGGALAGFPLLLGAARRPVRLLLRSSWQTINIGDIAHTPGMLALLERHVPQRQVTLWPNKLSAEVKSLLLRRFPRLQIADTAETQARALEECHFCLHGSGPGLVGAPQMQRWMDTGKPYGFGGVTLNDAELRGSRELLQKAAFVLCRDTDSLAALRGAITTLPETGFFPDATFYLDLQNPRAAEAFLKQHGLREKRFACFVPRLRYTPYWKEGRTMPPEQVAEREAINAKHAESDHAKLRAAIVAWVERTGFPALLCPEMTYQVHLLKPLLFDLLPASVQKHVILRPGYWLTDEAASTYRRAFAVVSFEMHSPIIAFANSTPAIHLRQPTDTRKGQMWRDVGLGDWLFEIDSSSGEQISERLIDIQKNPGAARKKLAKAADYVQQRGRVLKDLLHAAVG